MVAAFRLFAASLCVTTAWSFSLLQNAAHLTQTASHVLPHVAHHVNPAANLLHSYKDLLKNHPLQTKMATGATLAVCGDAIAQSQEQGTPYDKRRAASFGAFDTAYRAVQHAAFPVIVQQCHGQFLGALFTGLTIPSAYLAAMEQTLASQLGIVPFFYYPVFFALTAAIQGLDAEAAVQRAKDMFLPLMKRNLLFWIPVQFVQFGFVPEDLQIPFLSACGLAWTFILSVAAGSAKSYTTEEADSVIIPSEEIMGREAAITLDMNDAITNVLLPEIVEELQKEEKEPQLVGQQS